MIGINKFQVVLFSIFFLNVSFHIPGPQQLPPEDYLEIVSTTYKSFRLTAIWGSKGILKIRTFNEKGIVDSDSIKIFGYDPELPFLELDSSFVTISGKEKAVFSRLLVSKKNVVLGLADQFKYRLAIVVLEISSNGEFRVMQHGSTAGRPDKYIPTGCGTVQSLSHGKLRFLYEPAWDDETSGQYRAFCDLEITKDTLILKQREKIRSSALQEEVFLTTTHKNYVKLYSFIKDAYGDQD